MAAPFGAQRVKITAPVETVTSSRAGGDRVA
jgi:hypothetical protein